MFLRSISVWEIRVLGRGKLDTAAHLPWEVRPKHFLENRGAYDLILLEGRPGEFTKKDVDEDREVGLKLAVLSHTV